jgi:hypothetical protein
VGLFSPSQLEHKQKALSLFFSPEAKALRDDPVLGGETQELALLDHLLSGWKNLQDKGIDGRTGKSIKKFSLAVDDKVNMDERELIQAQILEVQNALKLGTDQKAGQFKTLSPEDRQYVDGLIRKHIGGADIGGIGGAGTNSRTYPLDYKDSKLAGTVIPVNFAPGQKQDRGVALLLDKAEMVDPDTGVALYGVEIDAMHRIPAAERPDLVADIGNIKMGPTSLNQSDGRREGAELETSRKQRDMNLYDQLFYLENGVRNKQRGGIDKQTNAENLAQTKLEKSIDSIRNSLK